MPKLCLLCGKRDDDGVWDTCAYCGEGTWMPLDEPAKPEPKPAAKADPKAKRSR